MSASFTATPAELGLVNQIFAQVDKQKLGILNGDVAVRVFGGAELPGPVLGEIWNIADEENNGWLSKTGTAKALRLIGHAQKGSKVSAALLAKQGPLAVIDGYTPIPQQSTGASIPKSPLPAFPPLSPQDKIKFQNIFNRSGPTNGLLNGEKARDIFLRSKLSNDRLVQIWNLADMRDRGALDVADFTIAMYFIQGLMTQQISFVPTTLPPGLYEQAGGQPITMPSSVATHLSGSSGSLSPVGSNFGRLQSQNTGQNHPLASDRTGLSSQPRAPTLPARPSAPFGPASVVQSNGKDTWDVSPSEKAEADDIFIGQLDMQNVGYIEGDVAVPFMLRSQLPGEALAQIWDLADINCDGRLTRDGFAIAYHLIKKKLAGQPLPSQLPPSLIPPSLRKQASFFQAPTSQPEPPRDLLDFDDTPPATAVSPQATGTMSILQPQSTGATAIPSRNNISDPFASSSSPFGTTTLASDLIEEHEDRLHTTSPPLQDQSAELGNVRNQLQSTSRSLESTIIERAKSESTVASQAAELTALQTQLSSAKATYETEVALLSQVRERFNTQSAEIQKTREELIRSESDLSAIRVEKAEIEQAFLRDKEEARDLHKRMIDAGQQAGQLRGEVEKAKKEAKQQKGRLAIARKQLAMKEAEKAKTEKELEEAKAEVQNVTKEAEEVEAQVTRLVEQPLPVRALSQDIIDVAAAQPLPASPESISTTKSNNPFERLAMSSSPSPRSQSPFIPFSGPALTSPIAAVEGQNNQAKPEPQSTFDDFFDVKETITTSAPAVEASEPAARANDDSVSKDIDTSAPASPMTAESTEHFVTPPTTAAHDPPLESTDNLTNAAEARFPTLDETTTFPPLDEVVSAGTEKKDPEQSTDLDTKLQENDESDSDDSDDDDDAPLTEVAQRAKDKITTPATQGRSEEVKPSASAATSTQDRPVSSFDDIFGSSDTSAQVPSAILSPEAPKPSSSPFDIPIVTEPSESSKPNDTAGVNAFDETLGSFSPPPSAAPVQFAFEGFEDSFDFGAAGGSQTSSLSRPTATVTPTSPAPALASQTITSPAQPTFDNIFPSPATTAQQRTVSTPVTNGSAAQPEAAKPTSFDDAFASFDANPDLNLESSFIASSKGLSAGPQAPSSSRPFPTSGPISPKGFDASSPRPSVNRMSSPGPRPASPPVRMTSPAPRKSTSSKESHEKLKESSTRQSKLTIRFPFGKKKNKNQESLPPPSSSTLSPPIKESGVTTPASDDDVEAVKLIVGMGFTRSKAIDALEKHAYDVTRAADSLLR